MKRILLLVCIVAVAIGSVFAGGSKEGADSAKPMVYKLGNAGGVNEPAAIACQYFTDLANEKLEGEVVFEFYPAEQLGDEPTMYENMQVDLQQAVLTAFDSLAPYARDLNIMSMAFAFKSHEHLFHYLRSDLAQPVFANLEEQGIHVVNFEFCKNPRVFLGKKPIRTPDDLKGVKFRIPNIPIFEKNVRALGAIPTITSWSEYPFALMQGVVDAGECTKESIYAVGFHKAAPYITLVDYAYPLECLSFSTKAWNRLSPEQQKIIEECAAEAAEKFNTEIIDRWEDDKEKIEAEDGVFVDFNRQDFIDKVAPLAKELDDEGFWDTKGLYEKVQALVD
jgi:TRAP-type C4-dicarboxylate transport system substrate-binding protein